MVMMTRSRRAVEVRDRCTRAVGLLGMIALAGAQYQYTVGMITPQELDLVVWLLRFVALWPTQRGEAEGPWAEQEMTVLRELFDCTWMDVHNRHLPSKIRYLLSLFQMNHCNWGAVLYVRTLPLRTSPRDVLMHLGYWVVEGEIIRHMYREG